MIEPFDPTYSGADLYRLYKDPENAVFFRHFDPLLTHDEFIAQAMSCGRILNIVDKGFSFVKYYPRARIANLSIILFPDHRNEGFGFLAAKKMMQYIFVDYDFNRVVMLISTDDKYTYELIKKGGFAWEATFKESCFYNHEFHHEHRFVMTRDKYLELYEGD